MPCSRAIAKTARNAEHASIAPGRGVPTRAEQRRRPTPRWPAGFHITLFSLQKHTAHTEQPLNSKRHVTAPTITISLLRIPFARARLAMARNQSGEQPQQPDRFTEFIREITLGTRVLMVRTVDEIETLITPASLFYCFLLAGHQHCRVFLHARRARRIVQIFNLRRPRVVAARVYAREDWHRWPLPWISSFDVLTGNLILSTYTRHLRLPHCDERLLPRRSAARRVQHDDAVVARRRHRTRARHGLLYRYAARAPRPCSTMISTAAFPILPFPSCFIAIARRRVCRRQRHVCRAARPRLHTRLVDCLQGDRRHVVARLLLGRLLGCDSAFWQSFEMRPFLSQSRSYHPFSSLPIRQAACFRWSCSRRDSAITSNREGLRRPFGFPLPIIGQIDSTFLVAQSPLIHVSCAVCPPVLHPTPPQPLWLLQCSRRRLSVGSAHSAANHDARHLVFGPPFRHSVRRRMCVSLFCA